MDVNDENCNRAFEIIGVYFANCYWNRHYKTAADSYKDGRYISVEESYKAVIERYNRAFGRMEGPSEKINPEYVGVIENLKNYYEDQINKMRILEGKHGSSVHLSYRDFVDTIAKFLLPKEEYEAMLKYDARKEKYFRAILTQSLTKFTLYIIREATNDVTDADIRHDVSRARGFMRHWSDKFTEILTKERNDVCNLILASRSGIDISKENMDSVPKLVVDRLQQEIHDLLVEKQELENTVNKYVDYIDALKTLLRKSEKARANAEKALRNARMPSTPGVPVPVSAPKPMPSVPSMPSPVSVPAEDPLEEIKRIEFSGEDYVKPPKSEKYLEEVANSAEDTDDDTGGTDDADGSDDDSDSADDDGSGTLSSGDELSADE